jgi:hypothetical protein
LELSKTPKFNLTAENFPKTTHQDKEWSINRSSDPTKKLDFVKNLILILKVFEQSSFEIIDEQHFVHSLKSVKSGRALLEK